MIDNRNLVLKYYSYIKDAPLSDLFRQDIIKTYSQLMVLSNYICQYFPDTGISTGS